MEPYNHVYKMTLDENLDMWIDKVKGNLHIHNLPNIKKIVNRVCLHGDRTDMLKVYVCISSIHDILENTEPCGDELCDTCEKKERFVKSLETYIHKIKLSVNIQ